MDDEFETDAEEIARWEAEREEIDRMIEERIARDEALYDIDAEY